MGNTNGLKDISMKLDSDKQFLIRASMIAIGIIVAVVYSSIESESTEEIVKNHITGLTSEEPERSVLTELFRGSYFIVLNIKFSNMPTDEEQFESRKGYYKTKVKEYICTNRVILSQFEKYTKIEANLVSIEPNKSMGLLSLRKSDCNRTL